MTTKRKTEFQKTRGQFGRAFATLGRSLPVMLRLNWRNVLMPWRLLPMPVALALIALVALAMVMDAGDTTGATVGGTLVPTALDCEEDEVIGFVGIPDLLVCLHVDTFCPTGQHVGVNDVCAVPVYATPTGTPTPTSTPMPTVAATLTNTPLP